jgi:hypothetical protein
MVQANVPIIAFNRGLIDKTALTRTDIDRTRLSAEVMTNWLPKTQGAMTIRPGTKYLGSSLNDTGAQWIEFAASTRDTALLELTPNVMRVWDSGDELISRPPVDTTVTLSDTGWYADHLGGGGVATSSEDLIPTMTAETTSGVTITASSYETATDISPPHGYPWKAADDNVHTLWIDTGIGKSALPSWWNVDFGSGNNKAVGSYSVRAGDLPSDLGNAPKNWRLLGSNYDTGTYATDTGKWYLEDEQSNETGWAVSEKRTFTLTDTGTSDAWRNWRLYVTAVDGDTELYIAEVEMFEDTGQYSSGEQAIFSSGTVTLNAGARGSLSRVRKRVIVDTGDQNVEHSLDVHVPRGPVTMRVGSVEGEDNYVSETSLGTGYHNLAFTPASDFHITLQTDAEVSRVVGPMAIGDSGTLELTTPWNGGTTPYVRYTQSADVVYVTAPNVQQHKIERRGTGRSWSIVEFEPSLGPFLPGRTSSAKLSVGAFRGNTTLTSDIPFFTAGHEGALFRLTHEGQDGQFALGNEEAVTDVVTLTGISDTGTPSAENERRITFQVTGTYAGTVTIERSFDDPEFGFRTVTADYITTGSASDTGTFAVTVDDEDDNLTVYYRARMSAYTSGTATVQVDYNGGAVTGICRVTGYENSTTVSVEVLSQFSRTGATDLWEESAWSGRRSWPTAVALHEGRLFFGGGASLWGSVSDDYENFDDLTEGDAAPLNKVLGAGPVDNIYYLVSLLRLVIGTAGAEIAVKSSSLDEPLTPANSSAKSFSTQGSADIRALPLDSRMLMVQRSRQRIYSIGFGTEVQTVSDYEAREMTVLVPNLMKAGIRSIAIQRQPDTRLHCVMEDGRVAIMTFEPQEEMLAWSLWTTDTGTDSAVEEAMVLPGVSEDRVYYHVRRTINGQTYRFLERWAQESECLGDTGLSWLADCAVSYTDTGRISAISDFAPHLAAQTIVAWADDTGQTDAGRDLTPDDTGGTQVLLTLDTGGDLTLDTGLGTVHHIVGGLPYVADYKSSKLAYAAQAGTALSQMKRVDRLALLLYQTHNNGILFGSDSGNLDPMPRRMDDEGVVDANKIFEEFDRLSMPFPGLWDEDSRVFVRGRAPRPATVTGLVPSTTVNEKL